MPGRSIAACAIPLSLALLVSACAHGSGPVPPVAHVTGQASRVRTFQVVYHRTHWTNAYAGARSSAAAGTQYRGNVTTLPPTVNYPTGIAADAKGDLYYITWGGPAAQLIEYHVNGAQQILATVPTNSYGVIYDDATKTAYVSSFYNLSGQNYPSILAVAQNGNISVLAGGTSIGYTDGQGGSASFTAPTGMTLDTSDGALYVADDTEVRRVTVAGDVSTLARAVFQGSMAFSGVTWNSKDGNFYASDPFATTIKKITPAGVVSTFAGRCAPQPIRMGCATLERNGDVAKSLFGEPTDIVSDASGNLYISDYMNGEIRKITPGGTVTTLAGSGWFGEVDGAGQNAEFAGPITLAMSGTALVVADNGSSSTTNGALRRVTTTGQVPPPPSTPISYVNTPSVAAEPYAIDWRAGTGSTLWYSELIGRVASLSTTGASHEYVYLSKPPFPTPDDIVLGSDATPWFLDLASGKIVHRTSGGAMQSWGLDYSEAPGQPSYPDQLAYAPNGNVWIVDAGSAVEYITPGGQLTQVINSRYPSFGGVAVATDGSIWLIAGPGIEEIDQNGNVLATLNLKAGDLVATPDGKILFTQSDAIGEIDPSSSVVNLYPIYQQVPWCSSCSRNINTVALASDGAWWFTEQGTGSIGRLDINAGYTEYRIYGPNAAPLDIVPGPDGNLWFTDFGAQKIGKIAVK